MFQRRPTIHPQAGTVLSAVKGSDTADHPLNTLGDKAHTGLAYNPSGPQKRVVVTKTATAPSAAAAKNMPATGGRAPQRTFSR